MKRQRGADARAESFWQRRASLFGALPIQRATVLRYALNVLFADPSQRPTPRLAPRTDDSSVSVALFVGAALLLLYALAVGIGLMGGDIALASAYAWMMPVPLALAACYAFGFLREPDVLRRDIGLLWSAAGWFCCALCLLALNGAARNSLASGLRLDQMTPSPLSWFFAILTIIGIAAGAWLSLKHWQSETT